MLHEYYSDHTFKISTSKKGSLFYFSCAARCHLSVNSVYSARQEVNSKRVQHFWENSRHLACITGQTSCFSAAGSPLTEKLIFCTHILSTTFQNYSPSVSSWLLRQLTSSLPQLFYFLHASLQMALVKSTNNHGP